MIFAPTKELMDSYKSKKITSEQFETEYIQLMEEREAMPYFDEHYEKSGSICLLCSEETPEDCHRRILAEMIESRHPSTKIKHL